MNYTWKVPKFTTAQEFYDFCDSQKASKYGLAAIAGKTPAEWWATTERGDWMEWLVEAIFKVTDKAMVKFARALNTAAAEYQQRVAAESWALYASGTSPAEFSRVEDAAWMEYWQKTAIAWRKILGNPFLENEEES